MLPNCLNPSLRLVIGSRAWRTERAAARDACFEAYSRLYEADLLNENLLPLSNSMDIEEEELGDTLGAVVETSHQFNPWEATAQPWSGNHLKKTRISLSQRSPATGDDLIMLLVARQSLPDVEPLRLYWDANTVVDISFGEGSSECPSDLNTTGLYRRVMHLLTRSGHTEYVADDRVDFAVMIIPDKSDGELETWYNSSYGKEPLSHYCGSSQIPQGWIRTQATRGAPHRFHSWRQASTDDMNDRFTDVDDDRHVENDDYRYHRCIDHHDVQQNGTLDERHAENDDNRQSEITCKRLARRRNFLKAVEPCNQDSEGRFSTQKLEQFAVQDCTVDRLSFEYARMSLFIPAILQHVSISRTAERLHATILNGIPFDNASHIKTAIVAPSVGWTFDYEEYEFFGDAVLKLVVGFQLFCEKPNWHEGYLSKKKDLLVSNSRLAKAALKLELDSFIITELFKSKKWSPPFISDMEQETNSKRNLRSKVLADVVEALIGAAYLDGGLSRSRACVHVFLPEISVTAPEPPTHSCVARGRTVFEAEALIGREFHSTTVLLEALTHPSCSNEVEAVSYQRLEFLGDAVLDMLVASKLASKRDIKKLRPNQMTQIKAALVNGHLLGFLCLGLFSDEMTSKAQEVDGKFEVLPTIRKVSLWKLMRYNSEAICKAQRQTLQRYSKLAGEIDTTLSTGTTYPWFQLAQLRPEKFFSDLIESIIGAIYVDTHGSFVDCERFITSIGLTSYMERLLQSNVDLAHPKTILLQLAGAKKVHFEPFKTGIAVATDDAIHGCRVLIDDLDIVEVKGCGSEEEATLLGARRATELLRNAEPLT